MKTFRDLVFHKNGTGGINSRTDFDNGFSLSVIAGGMAYSTPREDKDSPDDFASFEVAIFNGGGEFVTKDFLPGHDDDVIGWRTRTDIDNIMIKVQGGRKSLQDFDFAF